MNADNFIVRMHLESVLQFQDRKAWDVLSDADRETLQDEVATLPSELKTDEIESRMFDLLALRMQLANVDHNVSAFEKDRKKAVEIAMALEEKSAIPEVKKQLGYLQAMQDTQFWVGINLAGLEEMRLRLGRSEGSLNRHAVMRKGKTVGRFNAVNPLAEVSVVGIAGPIVEPNQPIEHSHGREAQIRVNRRLHRAAGRAW